MAVDKATAKAEARTAPRQMQQQLLAEATVRRRTSRPRLHVCSACMDSQLLLLLLTSACCSLSPQPSTCKVTPVLK